MPSVYRCDVHGARIHGALEGLRVTLLWRDGRYTRKLRVCPADLDELLTTHSGEWQPVTDDTLEPSEPLCSACGAPVGGERLRYDAFVYCWRRSEPQTEYYGIYCAPCASSVIQAFNLQPE